MISVVMLRTGVEIEDYLESGVLNIHEMLEVGGVGGGAFP